MREFGMASLLPASLHLHFAGPMARHKVVLTNLSYNLLLSLLLDVLSGLPLEQARTNSQDTPLKGALGCYTRKLQDSA